MAFTLQNLKIRNQVLLVILPPLVVLLGAVALAFLAYLSVVNGERAMSRAKQRAARNESLLRHTSEAFTAVRAQVGARQSNPPVPYDKAVSATLADLHALEDLEAGDPGQLQEVTQIRVEFDVFRNSWAQPTIALARTGAVQDASAVVAEGTERLNAVRTEAFKLRKGDEGQEENEIQGAEKLTRLMLVADVLLAVLMAAILIFLRGVVTRLILAPVIQLTRASEHVRRGGFAPTLPPLADNEFGNLTRSFSRMTAALRREREELTSLVRFSEAVTQCTSELEVYDLVLHSLKERFQPGQIIIFKLRIPENFLEAVATLVPLPKEVGSRAVIDEPHTCKAVRAGRSFVVNDVRVSAPCPSKFALPSEGSYFCGPLIAGGIIIGSVRLHATADVWTPERQRLLESYLSSAASALSTLRLLDGMKEQANIDLLTGLYNRRFMQEYARKLLAIARRHEQPVGVLMLDLDHFKSCNDVYGHEAGDCILRHFAKTVTEAIREANLVARYGGEEFVVVLPDTSAKSCVQVAERIRQAAMTMVVPSNTEKPLPQVTVSIGVAAFPEHGETLEEVIQASDRALYESKRGGRNRVTVAAEAEPAAA